jgi:hypothetical protein
MTNSRPRGGRDAPASKGSTMSDAEERIPCPHPIEFRGSADCHLCGNSGFILPGSPWLPPPVVAAEEAEWNRGERAKDAPAGSG